MLRTVGEGVDHPRWRKRRVKGEAKALGKWGSSRGLFLRSPNGVGTLGGRERFGPVPQGRMGMSAFWCWLCCQDTSLHPHPAPPHLGAPALETWEPRQQLLKPGTRSQLSWWVGRGREREGPGRGYWI